MIRHCVFVKLAPGAEQDWPEITAGLVQLGRELPGVLSVAAGSNVAPGGNMDKGFSEGLVIDFTDETTRDAYLAHPTHLELGGRLVAAAGGLDGVLIFDLATDDN